LGEGGPALEGFRRPALRKHDRDVSRGRFGRRHGEERDEPESRRHRGSGGRWDDAASDDRGGGRSHEVPSGEGRRPPQRDEARWLDGPPLLRIEERDVGGGGGGGRAPGRGGGGRPRAPGGAGGGRAPPRSRRPRRSERGGGDRSGRAGRGRPPSRSPGR